MDKPVMIRSFFEKIEKATAAPVTPMIHTPAAIAPQPAAVTAMPAAIPASTPMYNGTGALPLSFDRYSFNHTANNSDEYNPDCPPLTSHKGHTARVCFDDFGVGLPPMAGSNS